MLRLMRATQRRTPESHRQRTSTRDGERGSEREYASTPMRDLPSFRYVSRFIGLAGPGAVVFAMAYDNGAYSLPSRSFWAIAIWWAVILVVALRSVQARTVTRSTVAVVGALSAFALLTLVSPLWGSSTERAVNEFNRVSLYLGVFVLALLLSSRGSRARWCDSLALGICAVVVVSLISRFAPETFSDRGAVELLPTAVTRLSFPLGYWNGLAIFVALSIPLLLRAAAAPGPIYVRAAAVAPLPAIAVVMYLASSRGGYVTAAVGAVAFILLSPREVVAGSGRRYRKRGRCRRACHPGPAVRVRKRSVVRARARTVDVGVGRGRAYVTRGRGRLRDSARWSAWATRPDATSRRSHSDGNGHRGRRGSGCERPREPIPRVQAAA